MIIEKYPIRLFTEEPRDVYTISVPKLSEFLNKAVVLHDGIYGFFAVPELILSQDVMDIHKFAVLQPKQSIPERSTLVDILNVVYEVPDGQNADNPAEPTQGIMLFPVYKIH